MICAHVRQLFDGHKLPCADPACTRALGPIYRVVRRLGRPGIASAAAQTPPLTPSFEQVELRRGRVMTLDTHVRIWRWLTADECADLDFLDSCGVDALRRFTPRRAPGGREP